MAKYQKFHEHKIKSVFMLFFSLLCMLSLAQRPMGENTYFIMNSDIFKHEALKRGGIHFVECYGIEKDLGKVGSPDTVERFYASFDDSFRLVRDKYTSSTEEIVNEYTYKGNKTYKKKIDRGRQSLYDQNYTLEDEVFFLYENDRLVSSRFKFYSKRQNRLWKADTIVYNENHLPVYYYQFWGNVENSKEIDTLKGEYFYDKYNNLVTYTLHPISNMSLLLKYTGGSATTFFDSIVVENFVNQRLNLEDSIHSIVQPRNHIPDRAKYFYNSNKDLMEPKLIRLNNRNCELNVNLVPGYNIEANRHWVKKTMYDPHSNLPTKIIVLYGDVANIYYFKYSSIAPDWFK